LADTRTNSYCSTRDVSRYYKPGSTQSTITPNSISSSTVTFASASDASVLRAGDVIKMTSTEMPHGEIKEIIDVDGATVTLESAVSGTYDNALVVTPLSAFTPTSTPSSDEVLEMIQDMEDLIDDETKLAWRAKTYTDQRPELNFFAEGRHRWRPATRIYLPVAPLITPVSGTDTIYVFDGESETEYVANKTNSRNSGDYWVCEERGFIDIYSYSVKLYSGSVRIGSLRYGYVDSSGNPNPPKDIRQACAMLVAAELLEMETTISAVPGGGDVDSPKPDMRSERLLTKAHKILKRYRRDVAVL